MKHIRARVVHYHNNGTANTIVDPTPDFKWKKKKAHILGFQLNISVAPTSYLPEILKDKLGPLKSTVGWTKSLELLPKAWFTPVTQMQTQARYACAIIHLKY